MAVPKSKKSLSKKRSKLTFISKKRHNHFFGKKNQFNNFYKKNYSFSVNCNYCGFLINSKQGCPHCLSPNLLEHTIKSSKLSKKSIEVSKLLVKYPYLY